MFISRGTIGSVLPCALRLCHSAEPAAGGSWAVGRDRQLLCTGHTGSTAAALAKQLLHSRPTVADDEL
jgi:hypothetical protein